MVEDATQMVIEIFGGYYQAWFILDPVTNVYGTNDKIDIAKVTEALGNPGSVPRAKAHGRSAVARREHAHPSFPLTERVAPPTKDPSI